MQSNYLWPRLSFFLLLIAITIFAAGCAGSAASTGDPQGGNNQPTITFSANPTSIAPGGSSTLTWSSTNASSVTISPSVASTSLSGSAQVSPTQTTTYTATATGAGGTATATATITVQTSTPAPTMSATSDKTTITAGDLATLSWTSSNADTVSVNPPIEIEGVDQFPLNGSATVSPAQTTTYTFTATNAAGSSQSSVTITVNQVAPTITLTADNTSILPGGSATLSWTSTHATAITIDQGVGSVVVPSATQTVSPAATTTYTATATGPGGSATSAVTITVAASGQLAVSLSADPATISAGQTATLTWDSQNAASVTVSNCSACGGLSGSAQVSPSATTTYTATATDSGGNTQTASATVTVVSNGGLQNIKHVIFYMQENRSFDHYFGQLGAYRQRVHGLPASDIDSPDLTKMFTDVNGAQHKLFHTPTVCTDITSPGWNESHFFAHRANSAWQMDFWVKQQTDSQGSTIDPRYTRSLGYYTEQELPYYYELATQFATSDRFFSSVMGPTIPNRMFLFTGTSFGHVRPDEDLKQQQPNGRWNQLTFFEWMTKNNLKWKYYYQNGSVYLADFDVWTRGSDSTSGDTVAQTTVGRVRNISELYTILADPNADNLLAPVVFIEQDPSDMYDGLAIGYNEHPSNKYGIQPGAHNTKKIVDALMNSAAWKSSALILLYDEAGGFYDHVPPVSVPDPDGIAPIFKTGDLEQGPSPENLPYNFTQSGFRVPFIVISPWAKKGYVSHTPREHTSILAFIEARFGIPPLPSGRDRFYGADDFLEFFDFNNPTWLTPPPLPDQPWLNSKIAHDLNVLHPDRPVQADPNAGTCDKTQEVAPQ